MEEIKEDSQKGNEDIESDKEDDNKNTEKDKNNNNKNYNEQLTPNNEDENNNQNNNEIAITESEGTIAIGDDYLNRDDVEIEIYLEDELKEVIETNPKEDIDNYIDNIKNRFNKAKMMRLNTNTQKSINENSENTIDNNKNISNNPHNIILEDICKF